jgi:hypothetical protein
MVWLTVQTSTVSVSWVITLGECAMYLLDTQELNADLIEYLSLSIHRKNMLSKFIIFPLCSLTN